MKSVLQNVKTGEVSIEEITEPILKPGNILVRNAYSLVSAGTEKAVLDFSNANYLKKARMRPDLLRKVLNKAKNDGLWQTYKIVSELIEQKIQLGYSTSGKVIDVGEEITDIECGQKVACAGLFAATHSEIISVPRNLVVPVPEDVNFQDACYVTLGAIAIQGVRIAKLQLSENVVVYGLGLVGMVTMQLAIAAGCRVIGIDTDEYKLKLASSFGCETIIVKDGMEEAILNLTNGYGADKVLICAATKSNDPISRTPGFTRQKGVVVVVGDIGMNVPRREYYDKEIDIKISRSYGPGRYDLSYEEGGIDYPYGYVRWTENRNMQSVIDLLNRGKLSFSKITSHQIKINEALKAYDLIDGKIKEKYLGIIIEYDNKNSIKNSTKILRNKNSTNSSEIKLGIIGAGNFGKAFLLPAFNKQKNIRFQGIVTASGVSSSSMAEKYNMEFMSSKAEDLIENKEINSILVASRHDSHASYVMQCIENDKAVFVEKPLAINKSELNAIKELYDKKISEGKNPIIMVGYNRRFSPLAKLLKKVFSEIKKPISVIYRINAGEIPRTEWVHDPLQGGGRIIGEVCHFIDFITYITGEIPIKASGISLKENGKPIDDVVTLNIEYPNGSIGTIHYFSNGNSSMPKEYIEVFGGNISAKLTNFKSINFYGTKVSGKKYYLNQQKGFDEEAKAFAEYVKNGIPPITFSELYSTSLTSLIANEVIAKSEGLEVTL